jgi:hypothetical protein
MIEKADPGRDLARAGAIEIDAALDPRFLGAPAAPSSCAALF